jgi:uncharacterized protein (TIGR02266 family)
MGDTSMERRRSARVNVSIAIEIRDGRGFSIHSSHDISEGGVYFDRAIPHPVGEHVQLVFTLPGDDRPFSLEGEVVNVPDAHSYGMGIRFVSLRPNDLERLRKFTEEQETK